MIEKAEAIVEEFSMFDDWMDKYSYIIELGEETEAMSEDKKIKQNLISGCQSQLWLTVENKEGKLYFKADSDAIITKGIAQVLLRVINGETPQDILNNDLSFLDKIGLKEHLSPTRSNGLNSMIKQIKLYALVFKTKSEQS
jgi:cysteine desulfuration protein SufE